MFKVRDIMTNTVVSVGPDDQVEDAISQMLRHHVSGLPVTDADGDLLGVITEFDVLGMVYDVSIEHTKVYQYMTRNVLTVQADTTLVEAADRFLARPVRRFPVVDGEKLVGVLSRRDLIRFVRDARLGTKTAKQAAEARRAPATSAATQTQTT